MVAMVVRETYNINIVEAPALLSDCNLRALAAVNKKAAAV